jgi:hypothetical protein
MLRTTALEDGSRNVDFVEIGFTSPVQSSVVNCCWSSPAQSYLVSGPVETHDQIFVRSKTVYVFVGLSE